MSEEITYEDIDEYSHLFTMAPSFVLKRMAGKNSNLVAKFKPAIESHLSNLDDEHRKKLDIILNTDVDKLQSLMGEAHSRTGVKQYGILADPKNRNFIEMNLAEIKKII